LAVSVWHTVLKDLRVGKSGFDVFGVKTTHRDITTLRSFELLCLAKVVVILLGCAANHFPFFGDLHLLDDGFPSFLLHIVLLLWGDDDVETVGESLDVFFDAEGCFDGIHKFFEGIPRAIHRGFLATAKDDFNFHLVSAREEFLGLRSFEIEVVRVGAEANANTFGLDFFLFAFCLLFLLALSVEVFAVIENFADGRRRLGGDFDEIELLFFGAGDRLFGRHTLSDSSVSIHQKHKRHANLLVDARFWKLYGFRLRSSVSTSTHACMAFSCQLSAFSCWRKKLFPCLRGFQLSAIDLQPLR
jgi:hypothetical protein